MYVFLTPGLDKQIRSTFTPSVAHRLTGESAKKLGALHFWMLLVRESIQTPDLFLCWEEQEAYLMRGFFHIHIYFLCLTLL